ncbi:hypothetical protein Sste5346_001440 [Sporothrix stenoceras]|uniref:Protein NO VEIN C-terminal domain-containing protein n=1 Tax=Sporothrix stenoceras TaxID=5173 RepID=A0ABR3ZQK8_9PEZI
MAGRAAARKVVERMGRQNGYIPPELLERMKEQFPDDYDKFVGPVESLKNLAAASVKTLAQNLYSSSAKFVFELLQNYDDNQYTSLSADRSPSVSFHIYSDRIIASCNEDGFTEANVTAICSVGQSSKKNGGHGSSGADGMGYTGEKGIGFKSVFMAAEDVHIQSGDYSFRFQYGKGDSGLGMTTPIWTDTDESLEDNESHITLTLRLKHYIMIKHVVPNLAPNDNRTDLDGTSRSDGVVVLGFPITAQSVPVLKNEYLFAFLPVKQMGFKFLIHADFVTQANREDIVTTSERNQGLADGIADAFIKAVLWFRDHQELQYTWMRYLPHDQEYPWGSFWQGVISNIRDRLAHPARPVYYPHVKTNNPNMDLDIPPMLDFDVIEASAVANSSWKHLFDKLGVKTASTAVVRDAIVTADYYISDQSPYGVGLLLPAEGGTLASDLPTPQSLSWKEWLYTFIGVRRHLRLVDKDGKSLSTICRYIAEHRPEKIEVLCRDGSKASLSSTYLPLDGLEKIARRFMADEFFPWLQLEVDINEFQTFPTEWLPLDEAFNLGHRCSPVTFLLDILQHIAKGNVDAASVNNPERIYSLYVRLQSEVGASASPEEELKLEKQIRDCFTSQKLIYLPARGTIEARWADPNGCVTESLVDFLHKASLFLICEKHFPKVYSRDGSSLKTFFAKTLDINPFSWSDVINEVIFLKEARADIDMLRSLYTSIQDRQKSNHKKDPVEAQKNYGRLRDKFTDNALILGFQNNNVAGSGGGDANWNTPAQCLWTTSETQIPGRLSLNNLYPDLYDFFVKGLGVETMTIKMVYDKLVGAPMTIEETKQTIRSFSAMLGGAKDDAPKKLDVTALLAKQIFPVRMPTNRGGGVKLCKGTDDFALVDRESLAEAFAGQAKLLNFDLETTRQLQPFLKWAGLRARGLSNLVEEISCVAGDDKQIISSRDRNIRYKARALLSIAHAFDSPRLGSSPEHLYCLILCADTYLTDRITSELRLQQDGQTIKVEQAAASFHFAESPNGLQIHVRRDEVSQEMCFNGTLAKRICKWLMTDQRKNICEEISSKMVQAVQAVLSSKKTAMKGILDLHGVRFLDVPDGQKADDFTDEEDEDVEGDEDDYEDEDVEGDEDDYEDDDTPNSEHDNTLDSIDVDAGEDLYITSMMARSSISGTRVAPLPENYVPGVFGSRVVSVAADTYATDYTDLLNLVVQAAQQASIPMYGATQRSAILENTDTSFRIRRWLQHAAALEKFQQIGAAGELFSTIRRYARGHASYADMPDWTGRETADITYADTDGVLTQLLIEKGYLSSEGWSGARPQYFIEVKATVSANIETPFFMSGGQYERMQNLSDNEGGGSHENVYMIVRVFGLGSGFVGYKILVDPEKMRRRGELAFTTPEKWSVVVR